MGIFDWEGEDKLLNQAKQAVRVGTATSLRIWMRVLEIQERVSPVLRNQLRFHLTVLQRDTLEREWRQSVTDATSVFGRIDKDLSSLDGRLKAAEQCYNGFALTESELQRDNRLLLKRVLDVEEKNRKQSSEIDDLQTTVAFQEANGMVDTARIQKLEEQYDDLKNALSNIEARLCTCGDDSVRVFLL